MLLKNTYNLERINENTGHIWMYRKYEKKLSMFWLLRIQCKNAMVCRIFSIRINTCNFSWLKWKFSIFSIKNFFSCPKIPSSSISIQFIGSSGSNSIIFNVNYSHKLCYISQAVSQRITRVDGIHCTDETWNEICIQIQFQYRYVWRT